MYQEAEEGIVFALARNFSLAIEDWDYFNKQGLYIFDVIIVLFDNRLKSVSNIAVDEYRSNTLQNVEKSLKEAGLEDHQEVYLVLYNALLSVINGKSTRNALYLDEAKLFTKLVEAAQKRRSCPASQESGPTPSPRESGEGEKKSGNVFGKFTGAVKQFGGSQLERK
ncbi:hypothetical protein K435DRAFT_869964 [Dendrothele bispora CBS 962.96]|uniref:Uncharacterized protein n=1 Tax=Dendrothele bispora (strain CBS 962.96) TaxID=1314807 RepID=A0A4S8L7S3_DENBC|nr:hypothetical protein K435DRAFT_869964 [Dendrothele bispora CBS 962.96]